MTSVSVVVCTHLRARLGHLRRALESLRAQTTPPDEVIVVIDGDPSLTADVTAMDLAHTVITRERSGGLSHARNTGIKAASSELVAFLDDDATADPRWLETLVTALVRDPDALGVGGRSVPRWETAPPAWWPEEFLWVVGCTYRGLDGGSGRSGGSGESDGSGGMVVRNVFGGCACVRRSVFERVGGYSPDLGRTLGRQSGGEEAEFCVRARAALGGHFRYAPAAVIHHWVPADRLTLRYLLRRCVAEGESKAVVRASAGADSLGEEGSYLRRTIPAALGRAVLRTVTGHPREGGTVVPIVLGVGATVASHLLARARLRVRRHHLAPPPAITAGVRTSGTPAAPDTRVPGARTPDAPTPDVRPGGSDAPEPDAGRADAPVADASMVDARRGGHEA